MFALCYKTMLHEGTGLWHNLCQKTKLGRFQSSAAAKWAIQIRSSLGTVICAKSFFDNEVQAVFMSILIG